MSIERMHNREGGGLTGAIASIIDLPALDEAERVSIHTITQRTSRVGVS